MPKNNDNVEVSLRLTYGEVVQTLTEEELYQHVKITCGQLGIPTPARVHVKRAHAGDVIIRKVSCCQGARKRLQEAIGASTVALKAMQTTCDLRKIISVELANSEIGDRVSSVPLESRISSPRHKLPSFSEPAMISPFPDPVALRGVTPPTFARVSPAEQPSEHEGASPSPVLNLPSHLPSRPAWSVDQSTQLNPPSDILVAKSLKGQSMNTLDNLHVSRRKRALEGGDNDDRPQKIPKLQDPAPPLVLKLQEQINSLKRELEEERKRRTEAELVVEDIRREMKSPFLVPSLLDAFIAISTTATSVCVTEGPS